MFTGCLIAGKELHSTVPCVISLLLWQSNYYSSQVGSQFIVSSSNTKQTLLQYGSDRKKTLFSMSFSLFLFWFLCFFGLFLEVVVRFFLFATVRLIMREVLCNVYKKPFYIYKAVVHTRDGLLPLKSSIENLQISLMRFLFIINRNVVVDILEWGRFL